MAALLDRDAAPEARDRAMQQLVASAQAGDGHAAFYLGALVMPGTHTLPAWSSVVPGGDFSVQALGTWMQALGAPLLVGLPTLGLVMAVLGYATVQLLWLAPALQRKRRLARSR